MLQLLSGRARRVAGTSCVAATSQSHNQHFVAGSDHHDRGQSRPSDRIMRSGLVITSLTIESLQIRMGWRQLTAWRVHGARRNLSWFAPSLVLGAALGEPWQCWERHCHVRCGVNRKACSIMPWRLPCHRAGVDPLVRIARMPPSMASARSALTPFRPRDAHSAVRFHPVDPSDEHSHIVH